ILVFLLGIIILNTNCQSKSMNNMKSNLDRKNIKNQPLLNNPPKYYYYNFSGQEVFCENPEAIILMLKNGASESSLSAKLTKIGYSVLDSVANSELGNQKYLGIKVPQESTADELKDRLLNIVQMPEIDAAGYQLNASDAMNPLGFYTGVITIAMDASSSKEELSNFLKEHHLSEITTKEISGLHHIFLQAPEGSTTNHINYYIEQLKELKNIKEVAPEIFGAISNQ
ncbi:MAG: hypothetical protein AAF705_03615, partial [Bacteroidota bacterium]